jgi:2-dehydro-3-deoxygluconokinase
MPDVVTFGEAMLRLSPPDRLRLEQARSLELWPAGSELNVAIGLARLGTGVAWVSRLPASPLGRIVLEHARAAGVATSEVLLGEGRLGLYFVEVAEPPRASAALYDRQGSAFAALDPAELDWPRILADARAFHVTGITPALGPACSRAVDDALAAARAAGCHTSYDLNLRRRLGTPAEWRQRVEAVSGSIDTLVASTNDVAEVFGLDGEAAETAARLRDALGVARVVLSARTGGVEELRRASVCVDADGTLTAVSPAFRIVDPVGSGDAFCAGFLHGLLSGDAGRGLELGGAMAALKQSVAGDAPLVRPGELEVVLGATAAGMSR